jgi:dihydrodipicolinate synthase/N-acetylneuraminate lyase
LSSEDEIREALKQLTVRDVLLQTVVTLVNLAGRRLTVEEEKDLEQARLGIEAVRALLPLCPEEEVAPVKDALSQLQMIYVRETRQPSAPEEPPAAEQKRDAEERAKARSKIWTPPGTGKP